MTISDGYKANLETLQRAADNRDLALVECTDKVTGKPVIALCARSLRKRPNEEDEYTITPLAKMFDGNPYEELDPPFPEQE